MNEVEAMRDVLFFFFFFFFFCGEGRSVFVWCVFVLCDGCEKKKEEKREKGRDLSKPKKIENSPPTTGKHTHKQGVCACSFLFSFSSFAECTECRPNPQDSFFRGRARMVMEGREAHARPSSCASCFSFFLLLRPPLPF